MITLNMNRSEIRSHFKREEGLEVFFRHKVEEWKKIKKKMLPKQIGGKVWNWHSKRYHQDYLIVICKQLIYDEACILYAKVRGEKSVYYVSPSLNDDEMVCLYSTHFWKRYAERMHYLYNMPSLIAKFHSRNIHMNCIYYNKEERRAVYMTRDGILLCELDNNRGLYVVRTFVSNEMLKTTQKEAYKILDTINGQLDEYFKQAYKYDIVKEAQALIQNYVKQFSEQASNIYAQYWEDETE